MFYKVELRDHIRVSPRVFSDDLKESVLKSVKLKYDGFIDESIGIVIDALAVNEVGEGTIIPGDGAAYYEASFELLVYKPELQEVVLGRIKEIADFGAFMTMGPIEGMIHISQTMDDFVSFSKDGVLLGRESKRSLKAGDACRARIIAVSYKDITSPKIGLTMRQPSLGKLDWLAEPKQQKAKPKPEKESKSKKE